MSVTTRLATGLATVAATAALFTAGAVGAAPAQAQPISCSTTVGNPAPFGPQTVRSSVQTTCTPFNINAVRIAFRATVNDAWTDVTTARDPGYGTSFSVYSAPPPGAGYYRTEVAGRDVFSTVYSAEVYLVPS